MSHWWRAHDEAVDDVKLCLLSDMLHRAWFNIMCLCSASDGIVPPLAVVAVKLRMTPAKAAKVVEALVEARLLDKNETEIKAHNWEARQFRGDVSTERVQRHRKLKRAFLKRPQITETETERKEDTADAVPASEVRFAFESGAIRLTQKDFDQWKLAFSHLDLRAELLALTEWASQQGGSKWFFAVSGALAKRNREVGLRLEQGKTMPEFKWRSGIEGVV